MKFMRMAKANDKDPTQKHHNIAYSAKPTHKDLRTASRARHLYILKLIFGKCSLLFYFLPSSADDLIKVKDLTYVV